MPGAKVKPTPSDLRKHIIPQQLNNHVQIGKCVICLRADTEVNSKESAGRPECNYSL